jgi:hypothetical protein
MMIDYMRQANRFLDYFGTKPAGKLVVQHRGWWYHSKSSPEAKDMISKMLKLDPAAGATIDGS